ncbi:MAG: hypothetical protein ACRER2_03410 [Methylococcales bacterium]
MLAPAFQLSPLFTGHRAQSRRPKCSDKWTTFGLTRLGNVRVGLLFVEELRKFLIKSRKT